MLTKQCPSACTSFRVFEVAVITLVFSLCGCSGHSNVAPVVTQKDELAVDESKYREIESMLVVEKPTSEHPLTASVICIQDDVASRLTDVWVKLEIANAHYVYAPQLAGESKSSLIGLSVELQLRDGSPVPCQWEYPGAVKLDGHHVYIGAVLLKGKFKEPITTPETPELYASLKYQVCNPEVCLPPNNLKLPCAMINSCERN